MYREESLKNRIVRFLKNYPRWFNVGEIEGLAKDAGYLAQNAGRRCRELVNEGVIKKELRRSSVWYHII